MMIKHTRIKIFNGIITGVICLNNTTDKGCARSAQPGYWDTVKGCTRCAQPGHYTTDKGCAHRAQPGHYTTDKGCARSTQPGHWATDKGCAHSAQPGHCTTDKGCARSAQPGHYRTKWVRAERAPKSLVLLSYFSKPKKSEKILLTGVVGKQISN